jgi:type IV pilus assembly protein PilM
LKKEDEIAATNKLLRLIRGDKEIPGIEDSKDLSDTDDRVRSTESSTEEFSTVSLIREKGEETPFESAFPDDEEDDEEEEGFSSFSERLNQASSWHEPGGPENASEISPEIAPENAVDEPEDTPDRADATARDGFPSAQWEQEGHQETAERGSAFSDASSSHPASSFPSSSLPQQASPITSGAPRQVPSTLGRELGREVGVERESDQEVYRQQGELKGNMKSTLGLDIGSRYVKFVQLQRKMSKYHLISWGIVKILPKTSEAGMSPVTNILRGLFKGLSSSHIKVISSVGGASVIVRHIKFPPLSHKEIDESIRWEAKSYVPFPLRDVNIDYQILSKSAKNKEMDVLLVAVTKKLLQDHLDVLQNIQINPSIIDINSLALVNSFSSGNSGRDERAVVLLDIGFANTILNIYKKDDLYLTRDIPIAGDAFTIHLQKENRHPEGRSLSYEEAENIKFNKNFDINTIRPVLDNLTKEIRRSLIYYDNQTSRRGFSRIILTGGSSRISGLVSYFSEELGLTVEIANPLQTIQVDSRRFAQDELQFFSPQIALAVGLASR